MERISNDMQRVQAHRRNPFPPPVHARYAKFLPATQKFCPLSRFLVQSHFFNADLRAFCAKSAAGPLQWAFPAATTAVPVTNQSPLGGGALPWFHRSHSVEPHTKVRWRWRAVARRSSQLKPYLPAGAPIFSRWAGAIFPSIFGQAGRVLIALLSTRFTDTKPGAQKC